MVWDTEARALGAYRGKTGAGSFFVHYRVGGRQRKTTLGRVNEIAVADVRAKAAEIMVAASQVRDVVEERHVAEQTRLTLADALAQSPSP